MKVAQIIISLTPGTPGWGGAPKAAIDWAKALARKGVDVSVFTIGSESEEQYVLQKAKLAVYLSPECKSRIMRWWPFYTRALSGILAVEVPKHDIVHIHEIWHYPCYAAYRAASKVRKPYIVTVHGELEPWCLNYKALKKRVYAALIQRRILNRAAAIHAITQEEAKHIRAFGVNRPIFTIPNGINPEEFSELPPREEIEKFYPELQGKKVVLFLGRIHPKKGLDLLARAFGQVARERKDVHLVIVGPDERGYGSEVKRLLASEGVIEKVTFTGMLTGKEKLAALSRANICVIPSYSEVRTIVALEAMICGLPLIITRQCQFPEVGEARAGIVIDPDSAQLAGAMVELMDDPKLREEMGNNGRRLVMERFTWDKIADQMIGLYQRVLKGEV